MKNQLSTKPLKNAIFSLFLLSHFYSFCQTNTIRFEHLTPKEGLSTVTIRDILQDHQGFMWFGANPGLNKYDGHTIVTYYHNPEDSNSLGSSNIKSLYEDREGVLWIGTRDRGLNRYNRATDNFTVFEHNPKDRKSLSENFVRKIFEDRSGTFWIGTAGGLNKMDRENETFTPYQYDPKNNRSLAHNTIHDIFEDQSRQLWIGTSGGLSRYDPSSDQFVNYYHNPNDPNSLSANKVYAFSEDKQGTIWMGTAHGISKFEKETGLFTTYLFDKKNPKNNRIYKLKEDSSGNLWASVWGNGLMKFNKSTGQFIPVPLRKDNIKNIDIDIVSSIYEDRSKVLWIGSTAGGVNIYKPQSAGFIHLTHIPGKESISEGPITDIITDSKGEIWLANMNQVVEHISPNGAITTYKNFQKNGRNYPPGNAHDLLEDEDKVLWLASSNGIYKLNRSTGTFEFETIKVNGQSIDSYNAYILMTDHKGIIWVGMADGLYQYNKKDNDFIPYRYNPNNENSISNNIVFNLYEDRDALLWIGTANGLTVLDANRQQFTRYHYEKGNPLSINSNAINVVYEDTSGNLWVGTEAGLNLLDRATGNFRRFTTKEGLLDNVVYSIQEDEMHHLWISSVKGISRFDPKNKTFKNYNLENGMPIEEFYEHASFKAKDGKMYFGGSNGLIVFDPKNIQDNPIPPPIVLTDFKLFNKSVPTKTDSISNDAIYLDEHISITRSINLSYRDAVFSFDFVALDFVTPSQNRYAYKMEGFNEEWTYTDANNRTATYTNLDPGTYIFHVKAANADGLWNDNGTSVIINISPPWWKTTWAYLVYILSFLASLFAFIQWRAHRLKQEKIVLTKLVEERTQDLKDKNAQLDVKNLQLKDQAEKLRALDETKTRFFANISHEFRTPLTVILGLINKQIAKDTDAEKIQDGQVIKRNAHRLLELINQLLELSKLEAGEVQLNISKENIVYFTLKATLLFESLAQDKNLVVTFNGTPLSKEMPKERIDLCFDKEKLHKTLSNLISNAIKFTPKEGHIKIDLKPIEESGVQIKIANSGRGISADKLPYIFDRFYQADDATTREYEGTGIGLALVKELIELHQGNIVVESDEKWTCFTLTLPNNEHLLNGLESVTPSVEENIISTLVVNPTKTAVSDQLQILLVEDNLDLQHYVKGILENDYAITQATDGVEGLEKAQQFIPDLIISDVMMPNMDGYELCKHLKANDKTNHIPVIMLTAKAAQENKLEGLETGADAYLTKPFDEEELLIRIKNLISIRAQLQRKYQQEVALKPKGIKITSTHQKFLENIKEVIEENIDNEQFSVEDLGNAIAMSRSQVHRKLKALTNQSATKFIRDYRLYRAADLLKQKAGNVTEIAIQVGFGSQTYFSKCFQDLFGCSPTEYRVGS